MIYNPMGVSSGLSSYGVAHDDQAQVCFPSAKVGHMGTEG